MDADGIDAAFLYPSIGLFAGSIQDPETRCRDLSCLQPLVGRLLANPIPIACSGRDAADAIGGSGHCRDALARRNWDSAAASCGRTHKTINDPPPRLRAVRAAAEDLDFSIGFHEGGQQWHADGRRRPFRGRGAKHIISHTMEMCWPA